MLPARKAKISPLLPYNWVLLQAAHDSASRILGRSSKSHPYAERLAKQVFRLFDLGHRNIAIIAAVAAQTERAQARQSYNLNKVLKLVPSSEPGSRFPWSGCGQSRDGYH